VRIITCPGVRAASVMQLGRVDKQSAVRSSDSTTTCNYTHNCFSVPIAHSRIYFHLLTYPNGNPRSHTAVPRKPPPPLLPPPTAYRTPTLSTSTLPLHAPNHKMASSASKRLFKEYKALSSDPPEGLTAGPVNEDDMFVWEALIQGPEGTPFEGGIFPAELRFPKDYPLAPPKMKFVVDVWHPNGTL
jgi:hypothetical protein